MRDLRRAETNLGHVRAAGVKHIEDLWGAGSGWGVLGQY